MAPRALKRDRGGPLSTSGCPCRAPQPTQGWSVLSVANHIRADLQGHHQSAPDRRAANWPAYRQTVPSCPTLRLLSERRRPETNMRTDDVVALLITVDRLALDRRSQRS